ncbi:MAG: hypothetical protein E7316_10780 [Clostridiales bacterium]|nr:hypothetical protein [Clostridiales bacterium]
MKRIFFLMLLCVALLLTGCAQQAATDDKPAMYIEPAQLTAQEEQIKALSSPGRNCNIYDFQLGKDQHVITVNVYRLTDNQWELYTGGSQMHLPTQNGQGRFALNFGPLTDSIFASVLDENNGVMSLRQGPAEPLYDISGLDTETSSRTDLVEVRYGEEIPLLLQFITSKLQEVDPAPVISFHPEDLAPLGHEHVFLVTVTFSPMPVEHE